MAERGDVEPDDRDFYGNKRIELSIVRLSLGSTLRGLVQAVGSNSELKRIADIHLPKEHGRAAGHRQAHAIEDPQSVWPAVAAALAVWHHLPGGHAEGESCVLVKNLALISHITTDSEEAPVLRLLYNTGVEDVRPQKFHAVHSPDYYTVFLNGSLAGPTSDPTRIVQTVRLVRRNGYLNPFVSVSLNDGNRSISVACDGGRLCRPYVVMENCQPQLTQAHIDNIKSGKMTFNDLVSEGCVELLDVNKALVAVYEKDVEPFSLLGVVAGLIPSPNHNQSPRNTYQCATGKQAMGTTGYNQQKRIDSLMYLLVYPQKPIVKSKTIEFSNFENLPAGQNATVAVMRTVFGRCMVYKFSKGTTRKYPNQAYDRLMGPSLDAATLKPIHKHKHLDAAGIVLINKFMPTVQAENAIVPGGSSTNVEYKDVSVPYKGSEPVIAERVLLSYNNEDDAHLIKVVLAQCRRPELGDKFSSRHGQKDVCGIIVQQEDMPFDQAGMCPNLIMNGYPSRTIVGKLMQLLSGKNALMTGRLHY
ncbi:DNA-directed RNA polymerase [Aphelenchoides avenae]|nr:DNA-directed RNA polymerase [Aphelenchus avenae]